MSKVEQKIIDKKMIKKKVILIFVLFFIINVSVSGGHFDPTDGVMYFLMTENFVINGFPALKYGSPSAHELGVDINQHVAFQLWDKAVDAYYNEFGKHHGEGRMDWLWNYIKENEDHGANYLVVPILATPLYLTAKTIGISPISFVAILFNSIVIAAISVVIFLLGTKIYNSERIGFVLALLFGLTSFFWPYITTFYARPLAILFLFLSLYLILLLKEKKDYKLAGITGVVLGLSILTHPLLMLAVPGVLIFGIYQLRKNKRQVLFLLFGLLIMVGVQFYVNDARYDSAISFGYAKDDVSSRGTAYVQNIIPLDIINSGYIGYFFSPGQSIFIFFPISILTPIGLYYLYKQNRSLTFLLIYIMVSTFLYMANSPNWNTNPYWGSHRYLLPLIPAITLCIGSIIANYSHTLRLKIGIVTLASIGFIVNLLGNLVWIQYAFAFGWSQEELWKIVEREREIFTWEPFFSPPIQSMKVLYTDWVASLSVEPDVLNYMKVGLHGCSVDIFLYCEFGIVSTIICAISIVIILIFVLKHLNINMKIKTKIRPMEEKGN